MPMGKQALHKDGGNIMISRQKLARRSKEMRRKPTPSEELIMGKLRMRGIDFKFQVVVGFYVADFGFRRRNLLIEIDGGSHDDPEQQKYDACRDKLLKTAGFQILRIRVEDCWNWEPAVLDQYPDNDAAWHAWQVALGKVTYWKNAATRHHNKKWCDKKRKAKSCAPYSSATKPVIGHTT